MPHPLDRTAVESWLERYERAWRERDVAAVATLFTDDARYSVAPYEPDKRGRAAIEAFWAEPDDVTFDARHDIVAVDAPRAVVYYEVDYHSPKPQPFRDLWVLRFADDGLVDDFEEWPTWPGRGYTPPTD